VFFVQGAHGPTAAPRCSTTGIQWSIRLSKTSPTGPRPGAAPFEKPDAFVAYTVNTVFTRMEAS
jgi:hypothetical protein